MIALSILAGLLAITGIMTGLAWREARREVQELTRLVVSLRIHVDVLDRRRRDLLLENRRLRRDAVLILNEDDAYLAYYVNESPFSLN